MQARYVDGGLIEIGLRVITGGGGRGFFWPELSLLFCFSIIFLLKWPRLWPRCLGSHVAHFEYGMVHTGDIRSLADFELFMQMAFTGPDRQIAPSLPPAFTEFSRVSFLVVLHLFVLDTED